MVEERGLRARRSTARLPGGASQAKASELADLERTLSMGASKPRSMNRRWKPPGSPLHCSLPDTYRRKHTVFRVVSSQLTAKQHPRSLRTCRQAAGVGPRFIHRFLRTATGSRSAWLHICSRAGKKGLVGWVKSWWTARRPRPSLGRFGCDSGPASWSWFEQKARVRGRSSSLVALASTCLPRRSGTCCPASMWPADADRERRSRSLAVGCEGAAHGHRRPGCGGAARLGVRADLVGEANTGAVLDRGRTPAEQLAANDGLPPADAARGQRRPAAGDAPWVSRPLEEPIEDQRLQLGGLQDPSRTESKMIMERLLLSPDQVAESLGVCRSRVYDLMRTRELPSVKIGRARRVPVSAVRAYVDQLTDSRDLS
jgi:excisionase family DNA binding protein